MTTENKTEETKKRYWFKIINKNKENVILVPPHRKDEKVDLKTCSWEEFNKLFEFDEKDKNKCYLINEPEKEKKDIHKSEKPKKNKVKKHDKPKKHLVKNDKPTTVSKNNARTKIKPPHGSEFECTMSIGDIIKNSKSNK